MTPEEQAARPSDKAFALIAACASAHFYDGLCAECVDAALRTARQEEREAALEYIAEHGVPVTKPYLDKYYRALAQESDQ